jgi:hypothetical protein
MQVDYHWHDSSTPEFKLSFIELQVYKSMIFGLYISL